MRASISLRTMQFSIRNVGILASLVISGAMISAAFILSGSSIQSASAESAEELLRAYAALDTDADGLADWQEAIYGTSAQDAESVRKGVSDADAVQQGLVKPQFVAEEAAATEAPTGSVEKAPLDNTLTARFSRDFFGDYLSGRSATPPSSEDIAAFVADAVSELSVTRGTRYSSSDLSVSGGGEDALRAYAAAAEQGFSNLGVETGTGELRLFADAIHKNDDRALALVERVGKAYGTGARIFVRIPAPAEAIGAHLRLANALAHLSAVVGDMSTIREDPLRGFVGLTAYQGAAKELRDSLLDMHTSFEGVAIAPNEPGSGFYQLIMSSTQE